MDLSFTFFDAPTGIVPGPGSATALLLDAAVRQGGSATAVTQAGLRMPAAAEAADGPFAPPHGSFNVRVAARLSRWNQR